MRTWMYFILWSVVMVVLVSIMGVMSQKDEAREARIYCEMIQLWKQDSWLSPNQRRGWPPYRDDINCKEKKP